MREFRLKGETVTIREADMEAIRRAVIEKLTAEKSFPNSSIYRSLVEELEHSFIDLNPEDSRIGRWVLTEREGQLALVRIPARTAVNYIFVAKLARKQDRWVVTDFFQEVMKAL